MSAPPLHRRVRHGLARRHNWFQLVRFGVVGASGYVVNLAIYGLRSRPACTTGRGDGAWIGGVLNNFWWNRHWTFGAGEGHAGFQAARFFVVSFVAFLVSLGILTLLVETTAIPKLPAQALAIVAVTPLNFVGNKLWSFAR